jgi:hypothetical protein
MSATISRAVRVASGRGLFRSSRYACARITDEHVEAAERQSLTAIQTYRKIQRLLPGVLKVSIRSTINRHLKRDVFSTSDKVCKFRCITITQTQICQ